MDMELSEPFETAARRVVVAVTRDMKNRRIQGTQSPRRPKINLTFWVFTALIILNIGVFTSHGDPRDLFADTAQAAETTEYPARAVASKPKPSTPSEAAEQSEAELFVGPPAPVILAALTPEVDAKPPKVEVLKPAPEGEAKVEDIKVAQELEVPAAPAPNATSAALARLLKTYEPTAGVTVDSATKSVDRFKLKSGQNGHRKDERRIANTCIAFSTPRIGCLLSCKKLPNQDRLVRIDKEILTGLKLKPLTAIEGQTLLNCRVERHNRAVLRSHNPPGIQLVTSWITSHRDIVRTPSRGRKDLLL